MFSEDVSGVVADFDERRGDGHVVTDDGKRVWFHCTAIADGSRSIAEGTKVRFRVQPGLPGQWEAAGLRPV